jgi:hypothetical protein
VSLVERQMKLLRDRNIEMRHRLSQLMDVARDNDRLFDKTRRLILDLLDAGSLEEVVMAVEDSLRQDFQVPFVSLILFGDNAAPVGRWVSGSEAQQAIGGLLGGGKTVSGSLREHELASCSAKNSARSRLHRRGALEYQGWRAGHRQPRPAALQEQRRHPVPQLHRRSAGPRGATLHPDPALGALMERQLDAYCAHLRNERQVSNTPCWPTAATWKRSWPTAQPGHWRLGGAAIQQLRQLMARLHHHGQSSRSLARLLSAVRGLYRYLNREGLCSTTRPMAWRPPRASGACPRYSTPTAPATARWRRG